METLPSSFNQSSASSLFSCSRSDIPCHHFCLRHSKPLQCEDEEWFMTDEVEEEEEDEEVEEMQEDAEMMRTGLLDQLLDEAYAQYYDEPDEWEELASWYSAHMNREETVADSERQPNQPTEATSSDDGQDFHPAWRQDAVGTPAATGRFARSAEGTTSTSQGRSTRSSTREAAAAAAASSSSSTPRQQQQSTSAGSQQHRRPKERGWNELVAEQEREETTDRPSRNTRGRNNSAWNDTTLARELELYETFNDLFFPDPESGRL